MDPFLLLIGLYLKRTIRWERINLSKKMKVMRERDSFQLRKKTPVCNLFMRWCGGREEGGGSRPNWPGRDMTRERERERERDIFTMYTRANFNCFKKLRVTY